MVKTPTKPPKPIGTQIATSAMRGLRQQITNIPLEPFYCLKFTRRCVEDALGLPDRGFYSLIVGEDSNPTAYEIEQLFRRQRPKQLVATAQPGDLCFWPYSTTAKGVTTQWGHVGIAVQYRNQIYIAQNTMVAAGIRFGGALALISLEAMGKPSTILRLG